MIVGLILAGGLSSRAKTNKLTLLVDSKPLILHTIDTIRPYVDKVLVVTGKYDQELRPLLSDVDIVYNENYELGMFSSVLKGISIINDDVLILPGDMTNISGETFDAIIKADGAIRIPTYNNKTGHPLFLNKDMCSLLKKEDINSNLKLFVAKHEEEITLVPTNDPFIKFDIDTIEDYNRFINQRKDLTYEG